MTLYTEEQIAQQNLLNILMTLKPQFAPPAQQAQQLVPGIIRPQPRLSPGVFVPGAHLAGPMVYPQLPLPPVPPLPPLPPRPYPQPPRMQGPVPVRMRELHQPPPAKKPRKEPTSCARISPRAGAGMPLSNAPGSGSSQNVRPNALQLALTTDLQSTAQHHSSINGGSHLNSLPQTVEMPNTQEELARSDGNQNLEVRPIPAMQLAQPPNVLELRMAAVQKAAANGLDLRVHRRMDQPVNPQQPAEHLAPATPIFPPGQQLLQTQTAGTPHSVYSQGVGQGVRMQQPRPPHQWMNQRQPIGTQVQMSPIALQPISPLQLSPSAIPMLGQSTIHPRIVGQNQGVQDELQSPQPGQRRQSKSPRERNTVLVPSPKSAKSKVSPQPSPSVNPVQRPFVNQLSSAEAAQRTLFLNLLEAYEVERRAKEERNTKEPVSSPQPRTSPASLQGRSVGRQENAETPELTLFQQMQDQMMRDQPGPSREWNFLEDARRAQEILNRQEARTSLQPSTSAASMRNQNTIPPNFRLPGHITVLEDIPEDPMNQEPGPSHQWGTSRGFKRVQKEESPKNQESRTSPGSNTSASDTSEAEQQVPVVPTVAETENIAKEPSEGENMWDPEDFRKKWTKSLDVAVSTVMKMHMEKKQNAAVAPIPTPPEEPMVAPTDESVETPTGVPPETPSEVPDEQAPVEEPAEELADAHADGHVELSAVVSPDVPAVEPSEAPIAASTETSAGPPAAEAVEPQADESAETPAGLTEAEPVQPQATETLTDAPAEAVASPALSDVERRLKKSEVEFSKIDKRWHELYSRWGTKKTAKELATLTVSSTRSVATEEENDVDTNETTNDLMDTEIANSNELTIDDEIIDVVTCDDDMKDDHNERSDSGLSPSGPGSLDSSSRSSSSDSAQKVPSPGLSPKKSLEARFMADSE